MNQGPATGSQPFFFSMVKMGRFLLSHQGAGYCPRQMNFEKSTGVGMGLQFYPWLCQPHNLVVPQFPGSPKWEHGYGLPASSHGCKDKTRSLPAPSLETLQGLMQVFWF